jgi:acid stress-induced BolA-like protein IbaG/YrbA
MSSLVEQIQGAIETAIPGAKAQVQGGGGHFNIEVVWSGFEGKSTLEKQRLVYGAITALMKGDNAPLHAVDSLVTKTA